MLYEIKTNKVNHIDSCNQMYLNSLQEYFSKDKIKSVKVLPHRVNILFEDDTVSGYDKDDLYRILQMVHSNIIKIRK
jgi:hypothetical protein